MGKQFDRIEPQHREFILKQRIFFNATAASEGRVNLSPRDGASLRVTGPNTVIYRDLTGSGNETAAHLQVNGRLTLMFCALEGPPMILRLYGQGRIVGLRSAEYRSLLNSAFDGDEVAGDRQMVSLDVEMVQTSCGYGVPLFEYAGERPTLRRWAESKSAEQLERYWREKNSVSIDGLPTRILEANVRV